jgi:hypothetical protein
VLRIMKTLRVMVPLLIAVWPFAPPAVANSCRAKKLKTMHVCGIVVDGSGVPVQGATIKLVSTEGNSLTREVTTLNDGRFSLADAPAGYLFLATAAPQHNSGKWPLQVKGNAKGKQCKKPLVVHLAGCLGCGCGDWVNYK